MNLGEPLLTPFLLIPLYLQQSEFLRNITEYEYSALGGSARTELEAA